jgi:hypothetical protein
MKYLPCLSSRRHLAEHIQYLRGLWNTVLSLRADPLKFESSQTNHSKHFSSEIEGPPTFEEAQTLPIETKLESVQVDGEVPYQLVLQPRGHVVFSARFISEPNRLAYYNVSLLVRNYMEGEHNNC